MWSGGLVVALAAILWLAFFIPLWRRRSLALADQRNASRLQRTLQAFAAQANAQEVSTTERDHPVDAPRATAESPPAERRREAEMMNAPQHDDALRAQARARRWTRLGATISLVPAIAMIVSGSLGLAAGAGPALLIVGLVLGALAGAVLVQMARVAARAAARVVRPLAAPVASPLYDQGSTPTPAADAPLLVTDEARGWTPQPLPRPLHLEEGSRAGAVLARAAAQESLRKAVIDQLLAERAAERTPDTAVTEMPSRPAASSDSPYAAMGIVNDEQLGGGTDVAAIMRRRRATG